MGYNYPLPIITSEDAKQGVAFAASVIERCAQKSADSGSTDTAWRSQLARKEPYRPPTDENLLGNLNQAGRDGLEGMLTVVQSYCMHSYVRGRRCQGQRLLIT